MGGKVRLGKESQVLEIRGKRMCRQNTSLQLQEWEKLMKELWGCNDTERTAASCIQPHQQSASWHQHFLNISRILRTWCLSDLFYLFFTREPQAYSTRLPEQLSFTVSHVVHGKTMFGIPSWQLHFFWVAEYLNSTFYLEWIHLTLKERENVFVEWATIHVYHMGR